VEQVEVAPEYIGEEGDAGEDDAAAEIHESAGIAAESVDDIADDENVDLAAVLGGNIRKAPVAATEPEAEPESAHAATGA
jgi:small subunit ribosomal protein S2